MKYPEAKNLMEQGKVVAVGCIFYMIRDGKLMWRDDYDLKSEWEIADDVDFDTDDWRDAYDDGAQGGLMIFSPETVIWLEQLRYTISGYMLCVFAVIFIAGFIQMLWRSR